MYADSDAAVLQTKTVKPLLPGMQAPWRAGSMLLVTAVDPFDSLPIKMPLRSRGLMHHCRCCVALRLSPSGAD